MGITSITILCLLLLLHIAIVRPIITIKSASLTPIANGFNGAYVLTHIDEVSTVNNDQQWRIATHLQRTWQFIIILDNTWGFHPDIKSSLSFTINSPTLSRTHTFSDIILGFTTNNNDYVAMLIPMDSSGDTNKIYPNCVNTNKNSTFAVGDIASIPYSNRDCDIAGGSCNNWTNMKPQTDIVNKFPITIKFINNPLTNTLYLSFHSQQCTFINFPLNQGLKIYFAGNDSEQRLLIDSFDVEYSLLLPSIAPTSQPTIPSLSPTNIPTSTPTITPTNIPTTLTPTISPSIAPTSTPIISPTFSPTTMPSNLPTMVPSFSPSINPTLLTNTPTVSPTLSPTYSSFGCGDSDKGFLGNKKTITFPLRIPYDLDRLVIDTCGGFTDFNTTLSLFNKRNEMIAFDSDGCGDVIGKSKIVVNDVLAGQYDILLAQGGRNIEGLYRISISCNIPVKMMQFCSMFGPLNN